jgi:hypothetical protein
MKRQPVEKERILASYFSEKGLITRTYKESKKVKTKGNNNPINRWSNKLKKQFLFKISNVLIVLNQ